VAQLASARGLGPRGRRFESFHPDQIMQNISEILKSADVTLNDIVKVVIYVTDMAQMQELNEVYPTYFKEPFPVREAVCVQARPLGATIEVSGVASK
jgi:2-iminobutanoate/2-iminopropanoate deaminase